MSRLWATLLAATLGTVSGTAHATPQDLYGYGSRSPALGMTGVSFIDGYEAVYTNPAGLARTRKRGLFMGLQAGSYELRVDGEPFDLAPMRGAVIAVEIPLPFGGVLEDRLTMAAAFYTPADVILTGEVALPEVPQFPVLARAQTVAIQAGVGLSLHGAVDGLRLGLSVSGAANTFGLVRAGIDESTRFVSTTETELVASFAPIAGISYERGVWDVGLVYRAELATVSELDVETFNLPVELPQITVGGRVQYDPHTIAAELALRPNERLRLVAHVTARLWGNWTGIQQKTSESSYEPPDPEFHHTVSPRLALEHTTRRGAAEVRLRSGYAFEPTPAPRARMAEGRDADGDVHTSGGETVLVPLRYLDNHRHVLSAGVGMALPAGAMDLHLDGWLQAHHLTPRRHRVPSPSGSEPMRTKGFILAGGFTLGIRF